LPASNVTVCVALSGDAALNVDYAASATTLIVVHFALFRLARNDLRITPSILGTANRPASR